MQTLRGQHKTQLEKDGGFTSTQFVEKRDAGVERKVYRHGHLQGINTWCGGKRGRERKGVGKEKSGEEEALILLLKVREGIRVSIVDMHHSLQSYLLYRAHGDASRD